MTRLPHESRLVIDRPDLPEYELNAFCPITGEMTGLENHHISPRSFGTKSWWVQLPTGEVVGNRINLSSLAHYRVTVNKARISYEDGLFFWIEDEEKTPLRWQPPKYEGGNVIWYDKASVAGLQSATVFNQADVIRNLETGEIIRVTAVDSHEVEPGKECPSCHRRIPHPKKASSPKTKVFSTRVPVEDADSFDELIEGLAKHLGVYEKPHSRFWAIHYAAVAALQDESLKGALS